MSMRERSIEKAGRLRMDRNQQPQRINDPSLIAGRRKEIDNVMRKARRDPNVYWDKKLLEVEERDPNRWHHTGYKKLYVEDERSSIERSRSRSITPVRHRLNIKTDPRYQSPPKRPRSPSPRRIPMSRKPRSPSPKPRSATFSKRPPSPPGPHISKRKISTSSSSSSDSDYRSPPPQRHRAARTPPQAEREHRKLHTEKHVYEKIPTERLIKSSKQHVTPSSSTQHRRGSPKPRVTSTSDVVSNSKIKPVEVVHSPRRKKSKKSKDRHVPVRIKVEDEPKKRPRSPSTESSSSDEAGSVFSALTSNTKITLSERFGKIAQWSVDRSSEQSTRSNMDKNMRITKNSSSGDLKVSIEDGIQSPENPRPSYSPVRPAGHFPDALMTKGPVDLPWDDWSDVHVRYNYYKSRGYLSGLGLQDYVKWEDWWYQYQEWIRRCELWERTQMNRRRRKKLPISARLH